MKSRIKSPSDILFSLFTIRVQIFIKSGSNNASMVTKGNEEEICCNVSSTACGHLPYTWRPSKLDGPPLIPHSVPHIHIRV